MIARCKARYIEDGWADMVQCEEKPHTPGGYHRAGGHSWTDVEAIWPKTGTPPSMERYPGAPASGRQVGGEHYRDTEIQPWDIIDAHNLGYYRGNALKYLLRAGKKGPAVQDLRKAIHYIEKCIEREEGK